MRIAPAIGTALALVAMAAPTTPAHSSEARLAPPSQEHAHSVSDAPRSASTRVAAKAKAKMPDRITNISGRPGPEPGTTKISWESKGGHTDFYRITTALTPFGSKSHPGDGRHSMSWRVPASDRSFTMSADQTADAGARLGSARHLFFRIKAVHSGQANRVVRAYGHLGSTPVTGRSASGNGSVLRVVQYNMHVSSKDVAGHPWRDRQHLIAKNIAKTNPAVASIQELMPNMWTDGGGGVGLKQALKQAGAGRYELTRTTPYWKESGQDTRILYDPNKLTLVSNCPEDTPSCYVMLPDSRKHVAAYAKFRDQSSGEEFYFVSAHLSAGNDADTDALRGRQAAAMDAGIRDVNGQDLPVIFGTDANSSQTSEGVDAPHVALLDAGWYNTQAAAEVENDRVNSVNHYEAQSPSPYGFGSMYDSIMTLNLPGADLWKQVLTGSPWPSDHNLVYAELRLP